jgi:hypothetical protein
MLVLGVDPGKRAGWCLMRSDPEPVVVRSGIVHGDDLAQIEAIVNIHGTRGRVVVEDQYRPGKKKPMSPKSLKTLFRRRFNWEITARLLGIDVHAINPSEWQGFFHLPRKDVKAAIKQFAQVYKKDPEPDEADAILIAAWACMGGVTGATNQSTKGDANGFNF